MKKTFLLAALLLITAGNAATASPYGLNCTVTFPGQRTEKIRFDIDDRVNKYTARIGDKVLRRAQPFQIEYTMSMSLQPPSVRAITLDYPNPPDFWFVIIDVRYQVKVATSTGRTEIPVGFCTDDDFKSL